MSEEAKVKIEGVNVDVNKVLKMRAEVINIYRDRIKHVSPMLGTSMLNAYMAATDDMLRIMDHARVE
jgi:hypothetical protein